MSIVQSGVANFEASPSEGEKEYVIVESPALRHESISMTDRNALTHGSTSIIGKA
jgi:hypothetical protein